jgi:hypothetical protein
MTNLLSCLLFGSRSPADNPVCTITSVHLGFAARVPRNPRQTDASGDAIEWATTKLVAQWLAWMLTALHGAVTTVAIFQVGCWRPSENWPRTLLMVGAPAERLLATHEKWPPPARP